MDSRSRLGAKLGHQRANTSLGGYEGKILGTSQRQRRKMEADAQLLANRINLLQQENIKAHKKILETEKRTNMIEAARARNEAKWNEKLKRDQEKRDKINKMREDINRRRYDQILNQRTRNAKSVDYKKSNVRMMRETSTENGKELAKANELQQLNKKLRYRKVRSDAANGKEKVNEFRNRRVQYFRKYYEDRIEKEEHDKFQAEFEMTEMEKMEHELIRRLQNTQKEQKRAYDKLEQVLTGEQSRTVK